MKTLKVSERTHKVLSLVKADLGCRSFDEVLLELCRVGYPEFVGEV